MADYIERQKVIDMLENAALISDEDGEYSGYCTEDVDIDSIPAADVAPVVHAQWIYRGEEKGYQCSACQSFCLLNYESDWCKSECCPHCGAKMDGDSHE